MTTYHADPIQDKALPYNLDAERAILGSVLLENSLINHAVSLIKPEVFYYDSHRRIFAKMIQLSETNTAIDLISLGEELKRSLEFEQIGGYSALSALTEGQPVTANIDRYAEIVKGKYLLRQLINSCHKVIAECFEGEDEPSVVLEHAETAIFALADDRVKEGFAHVRLIAQQQLESVEKMAETGGKMLTGLKTDFTDFDRLTNGLQRSDLIILAGRPSSGKTALALKMASGVASDGFSTVGVFSLEMSKLQLVQRMLCCESRVDAHRMRSGFLNREEWGRLAEGLGKLAEMNIYIDDTAAMSILEMRAKARRLKAEHGLDLLVVDYLQLMSGRSRKENRQQEVSQISRDLKALAKELNVPVIALSQLSRSSETRSDHRPQLSDLRESGSIEQDADVVGFIYREEMYRESEENRGIAELIIAKQRNGPIGTIRMAFIREFTRFENLWTE